MASLTKHYSKGLSSTQEAATSLNEQEEHHFRAHSSSIFLLDKSVISQISQGMHVLSLRQNYVRRDKSHKFLLLRQAEIFPDDG